MTDVEWQDAYRRAAKQMVDRHGSIREAARQLGVNHEGLRRLVNGGPVPRGPDRERYLQLSPVPPNDTLRDAVPASSRDPAGRTFASEAERISYALGVLDMASTSNRLVLETSNEVSRAISAASAALLAPISGPAPVAPVKSDAEYIAESTAAQAAAAAAGVTRAGKTRRATGR
jgi:hypothetical protein